MIKNIDNITYDIIKTEFINLIKDYQHFPFDDKKAQKAVAANILESVFAKTHIFVTTAEKEELLVKLLDTVVFGLRQIQKYQDNPSIEEIMINGQKSIYIKKRLSDKIEKTEITNLSENETTAVIEKLLENTGRRVDRSSPIVDVRLADGSRVNIIMPPLAINGPYITIRKFPEVPITADDLIKNKTLNKEIYDFLKTAVENKKNILISGSTAAGKTTTLSALTGFIKEDDRVVIIEETGEIRLPDKIENQIHLETRSANIEGRGEYTIRDLLKASLRMRPDRIIVGEVRGAEAFDMLQALNTGHRGSFTTLHANSTTDAVIRLESMILTAGIEQLPLNIIKYWVTRSIDIAIHQKIAKDGIRRIVEVSAIDKSSKVNFEKSSEIRLIPLFTFEKGKFVKNIKNYDKFIKQVI